MLMKMKPITARTMPRRVNLILFARSALSRTSALIRRSASLSGSSIELPLPYKFSGASFAHAANIQYLPTCIIKGYDTKSKCSGNFFEGYSLGTTTLSGGASPTGIEPAHSVPETDALSTELRGLHHDYIIKSQLPFLFLTYSL